MIPGGVNSPVRAFKSVGGTPVFMQHAKGAYMYDVDGNRYIDYINSWGPMILGHAYEPVVKAIQEYAAYSTSFGAPTQLEVEVAELIVSMVPNIDMVRMVNSSLESVAITRSICRQSAEAQDIALVPAGLGTGGRLEAGIVTVGFKQQRCIRQRSGGH